MCFTAQSALVDSCWVGAEKRLIDRSSLISYLSLILSLIHPPTLGKVVQSLLCLTGEEVLT